jgi:hypothetical protein
VLDPPDRDPLDARVALGPRITITGVFVLRLVYFRMIVRPLRNYGSYQNFSRTFPPLDTGMGMRNEFGKAVNELEASSAKRPRARDIGAAPQPRRNQRPQKKFLPLFWTLPHHGSHLSPLRQGKVNIECITSLILP